MSTTEYKSPLQPTIIVKPSLSFKNVTNSKKKKTTSNRNRPQIQMTEIAQRPIRQMQRSISLFGEHDCME